MRVRELARRLGVGVGMVLEGGYNVPVLSECVLATLPALLGEQQPRAARPLGPASRSSSRTPWPKPGGVGRL